MNREILIVVISILLVAQYGTTGCALLPVEEEQTDSYSDEAQMARYDIGVGMQTRDVKTAWGEPTRVYQAGRSESGNQKWVYTDGASAHWGQQGARVIYFEKGRVVGWETLDAPFM